MTSTAARKATRYTGVFRGRPDQVSRARREVARYLADCPAADDAVVIASELVTNAILYSESGGQFLTLRCELGLESCRVEVEDLGGPWQREAGRDHRHGLDIVEALAGAGNWGVTGDESGRTVWARLSW